MSFISRFLDHTSITNYCKLLHGLFSVPFYPFAPTREVNSQLLMFGEHIGEKIESVFKLKLKINSWF